AVKNKPAFWLKRYPEQPSSEHLVTELDRRLGGYGLPPRQFVAVHHAPLKTQKETHTTQTPPPLSPDTTPHPERISTELHHDLTERQQELAQLDFLSFTRTLLRVLLTNPENDKGHDYFLAQIPEVKETIRYRLIRIDNEQAFFPAMALTTKASLQEE